MPQATAQSQSSENLTHLEVHSHYTLLGGTLSIPDLIDLAQADGLSHLALTDSNALYGAVAFQRACLAAEIQPHIGLTVRAAWDADLPPALQAETGKLVLLAEGPIGYRSLCRLASFIQGQADREQIIAQGLSWETLKANRAGLICLSGGRFGWVERLLRAGDQAAAYHYAAHLAGIFEENAYLALELHQPADERTAREVEAIAAPLGLPTVAVQPVFLREPDEMDRLKLLAAIGRNCRLDEVPDRSLPTEGDPAVELTWLSPTELADRFANFPQALASVGEIVARCQPALPDGSPLWPVPDLPAGQTPELALTTLAAAGLADRYGPDANDEPHRRLETELAAITDLGFAPLFLVVADIVRFARAEGIPVSTRGSVANSLVAYCTGITTVDPVRHGLLFERFLNPARLDPPDIDLDLCSRPEIIA